MGIATVAVFAAPDARARHVREADEAIRLAGDAPVAAYLNVGALLDAARHAGADAIHPGYGFLAENAAFATACRNAGLTFVGPEPEVIAQMGSKREARQLVAAAGIPVIPGYDGSDQSDMRLIAEMARTGYPVMVKAAAGGGGRGMRLVASASDASEALASARREALSAFGDETLLLERAIDNPRHIEFQIMGDHHGALIHLGERECSIQRHHQKLIEETPAPGLTAELREQMADAALAVGRLLNYTNAGTVEFIVDPSSAFYFLEVNTRLQVEHPITELVTGLDLVRWQIEIAEGKPLPVTQGQVARYGHAIEARLCAEDPERGFLPSTGRLYQWHEPERARVDAGVHGGDDISRHFDSLIAKISIHADTRQEAARSLASAVERTVALGVRTNAAFLARMLRHPSFLAGDTTTTFIERHIDDLLAPASSRSGGARGAEMAALFAALACVKSGSGAAHYVAPVRWRNNPSRHTERFVVRWPSAVPIKTGEILAISLTPSGTTRFDATCETSSGVWHGAVLVREGTNLRHIAEVDGHALIASVIQGEKNTVWVALAGQTWELERISSLGEREGASQTAGSLLAPMPGVVLAVLVAAGQNVSAGDPLMTLEAMKMEQTVRAPHDGVIAAIHFAPGEQVTAGATLLTIQPEDSEGL
jgi:geranyl-CoA carboxylase alpha subunit